MKVSVIIPTYNRRVWLQEAIDSVLAQRGVEFECIVVDDGSTDGTGEALAERYGNRIRYIWQENQGESMARNHGAELADGEYLAFLDSDDLWFPDKLCKQIKYLDEKPDYAAVYCLATGINESGKKIPRLAYGAHIKGQEISLPDILQNGLPLGGSTIVIRHEIFKQIGGYDSLIHHGEDVDFCLQILARGLLIGLLHEPLTMIRSHSQSQSLSLSEPRFLAIDQDHIRIYSKLFSSSVSNEIKELADQAILKQNMRLFLFFTYIGSRQKAEAYENQILKKSPSFLSDSKNYYNQIAYFTPLVYAVNLSQSDVLRFVHTALSERNRFSPKEPLNDALILLKTSIWCAGRGEKQDYRIAWQQVIKQIKDQPRLILIPAFWKQLSRLLFGKFVICLMSKWG